MIKLWAVPAAVVLVGGSLLGFAAPALADGDSSPSSSTGDVASTTTQADPAAVPTVPAAPVVVPVTPVVPAAPIVAPATVVAAPQAAPTPEVVVPPTPVVTPTVAPQVVTDTGATTDVSWVVPAGGTESSPFAGGAQTLLTSANNCGFPNTLVQNDVWKYGTPDEIALADSLKSSGSLDNYADGPIFISVTWSYLPLCAPSTAPVGSFSPATCTSGATYTLPELGAGWKYALQSDGSRPVAGTFPLAAGTSVDVVAHTTGNYTPAEVDFNYTGQDQLAASSDACATVETGTHSTSVAACTVPLDGTTTPNGLTISAVPGGIWSVHDYNSDGTIDNGNSLPVNTGYTTDHPNDGYRLYTLTLSDADSTDGYTVTPLTFDWTPVDASTLSCTPAVVPVPPVVTPPASTPPAVVPSVPASDNTSTDDSSLAHTGSNVNIDGIATFGGGLAAAGLILGLIAYKRRRAVK